MTAMQELYSWLTPPKVETSPAPEIGQPAPADGLLTIPRPDGKPTVVTFLRHCGCPFAEKTFLRLHAAATQHPDVHFVAVSHSNQPHTTRWLHDVLAATTTTNNNNNNNNSSTGNVDAQRASEPSPPQPPPPQLPANLDVEVDEGRAAFAAWGLGVSSMWHVLSPRGLYDVYRLARDEGIANRPTESGYRWQTSGSWAADARGRVVWGGPVGGASEIPDFEEAVGAVRREGREGGG